MKSRFGKFASLFALSLLIFGCSSDESSPSDAQCAEGAECGDLASVRLTLLDVRYDLNEPVYVNNRIPVRFGLKADSVDPANPATRNVAVSFSLVDANPSDPNSPEGCGSNAFDLELVGDGKEYVFDGFIWPTTICENLAGRTVNLHVEFDGAENSETGIDYPSVTFSAAQKDGALNQLCRKDETASAGDGCVYDIGLAATPTDGSDTLIDVRVAGVVPSSSVAVLDRTKEDRQPAATLVVQSTLVVNGRDPYIAPVSADEIPADLKALEPDIEEELRFGLAESEVGQLTAMPGAAWVRYEIAPTGTDTYRPLLIGADRDEKATIESLMPGSPNVFNHELYADGETRTALEGEWASMDDFTVRGCFEADFTQEGNRGDGNLSDCREFDVVMVRERESSSSALSFEFNAERSHTVGNSRIGLEAYFGTTNRLDLEGASSNVEGRVSIKGKLGKSFSLDVAKAFGNAHLGTDSASTGYELGVVVFGQNLLSVARDESSIVEEREFSQGKSHNIGGLGFGFGPVKIGFQFKVGGEVFLNVTDRLDAITGSEACGELLGSTDSLPACGQVSRQVAPGFAFTADIFGGINLKIVKAGVNANLRLLETSFPLTASLAFGARDDGAILVKGNALWERTLTLIKGKVSIVGKIGFRRWAKKLTVTLFTFSSKTKSETLLDYSLGNLEVLN